MDKAELEKLHADLLIAWNKQDATKMASFFTDNGISIGFDGSQYNGKKEIKANSIDILNTGILEIKPLPRCKAL